MAPVAQSGFSTMNWQPNPAESPVLFERYQILGILGEGGMGTVFKGYHLNLKRHVAIKTLRIDHRNSDEMARRFLTEMESVGQMDHPNVVRATDAGEKNGVFYLVMEYLPGSDLSRLASRQGRLDSATACALTRQAAIGLDYIHQTLIHRDIKPSNLFLTTSGLVKILDLGLARFSLSESVDRENTPTGCAVGTYAYMAPEQAEAGAAIDGRADLYSLGCTLFKLVTGHAPYSGRDYDSAAKVLYAHRHVPLTSVALFETIAQPLRGVLEKMMAKLPDERYQTGKDVAAALMPFMEGAEADSSRLLRPASETVDETPVKPLPWPLPAELSRLTDSPKETPIDTPSATNTLKPSQTPPAPRRVRRNWIAAACVGALAFVGFLALASMRHAPPAEGVRDLDVLTPRSIHPLLDQKPFALAGALDDARLCRWNKHEQSVDVIGPGSFLFLLGKTTRPRYTFEAALSQSPWTGNVGIFWGYHEDDELKKDEIHKQKGIHGPDFGWFQMLRLDLDSGPQHAQRCSVSRVTGTVRYNKSGEMGVNLFEEMSEPVTFPRNGVAVLKLEVIENRPRLAWFNGVPMTKLYDAQTNKATPPMSARGALGLISARHAGTFHSARFTINANK